jgi:hypothetical protein
MNKFISRHRDIIINSLLILIATVLLLNAIIIILNLTSLTTAQLELIVTSITGITTIVIISWALNESRKSNKIIMHQNTIMMHQNKILMGQSVYDDYVNDINLLIDKGAECVYSDRDIDFYKTSQSTDLNDINYLNLCFNTDVMLMIIVDNEYYQKYYPKLAKEQSVIVEKDDNKGIGALIAYMNVITDGYRNFMRWENEILFMHKSILENKSLLKQQKAQLFSMFENKCGDFQIYLNNVIDCESEESSNVFTNQHKAIIFTRVPKNNTSYLMNKGEFLAHPLKVYKRILEYKTKLSNLIE